MPKKLTKDQNYYRKKKEESQRDFRKVTREDSKEGKRVTRKSTTFRVSQDAAERFKQMADDIGITQWKMATRMIMLGLPGIESSGYGSFDSLSMKYTWNETYLNYPEKKIRYKGNKGDVQLNLHMTTTMWKELTCHSNATTRSKSRIFQDLCLTYKPMARERLEKQNQKRCEETAYWNSLKSYSQPTSKEEQSKFVDTGGGIYEHSKGIPCEYWDDSELDAWEALMDLD